MSDAYDKELEILDLKYEPAKINHKKLIIIAAALIAVNTIVYPFIVKGFGTVYGWGTVLTANIVSFNILAFLLAALFAIIPYRNLPYSKKYLRTALITSITIQAIESLFLLGLVIMSFLSLY